MSDVISMSKGETVELSKKVPGLHKVFAGAGWDVKQSGAAMDLDLAAFMLDATGKVSGKGSFIYFNNKSSICGSLQHGGDNLTGAGEGDDETISVNLSTIPESIKEILFVASIYQATQRNQSLKDLDNAFIRIVNQEGNAEIANYKINDPNATGTTFVLGKLVRTGTEWNFTAIGEAETRDLTGLATNYGFQVAA